MDDANLELVRTLVVAVISVLAPTIIALLKTALTNIPSKLIPIISPAIGVLLAAVAQFFGIDVGGTGAVVATGALGGAAGIGVREIVDQQRKPAPPS